MPDVWFWPFGWWHEAAQAWAEATARFFGYPVFSPLDKTQTDQAHTKGRLPLAPGLLPVDPWIVLRTWMPHVDTVLNPDSGDKTDAVAPQAQPLASASPHLPEHTENTENTVVATPVALVPPPQAAPKTRRAASKPKATPASKPTATRRAPKKAAALVATPETPPAAPVATPPAGESASVSTPE